ncbi:hypothetical protein L0U85_01315 [Glycomyces sp. L485]|uniref:hypothetical protein n=1 Tax=Glycomyces sp. L485 TaxID=2909235 RepID=UPI001F4B094E|nr:hypothetical protein [Glycomyces sp. L485]MCH7229506.1 hypothetical protein [Glycomyces sp. L485]
MSEQQSGAGYPQQPTSGQPQQQGYPPQYASPQAQYQAQQAQQQQYAAYAPQSPSLFDKLGVPSMSAILGMSGLGALALAGLIAGTSDSTRLGEYIGSEFGGVQTTLVGVIVMFALTLFAGERLRPLWKTLTLAAGAVFLAEFLYVVLDLPDGDSGSDASAWIAAILLLGAYGVFVAGAIMVPGSADEAAAKAAKQQAAAQQQAAAPQQAAQQQPQQPGGYATGYAGSQPTQQNQWPQPPQQ